MGRVFETQRGSTPAFGALVPAATADQARIAQDYQREFELTAKEWDETRADWKSKVAAALKEGTAPPEKPKFKAGKNRFFSEVVLAIGPFALPEKEQEQEAVFSATNEPARHPAPGNLKNLKTSGRRNRRWPAPCRRNRNYAKRVFVRGNTKTKATWFPNGSL